MTLAAGLIVALPLIPVGAASLLAAGGSRTNYRGRRLAFPLGATVFLTGLLALGPLAAFDARIDDGLLPAGSGRWLTYMAGVAFLGLLDDLLASDETAGIDRGWRGHLAALAEGRLSTGAIKAAGSLALALYVLADTGSGWVGYGVDVLLLLLVTNLFNLLDLRGGRVEKALIVLLAVVCLANWSLVPLGIAALWVGPFLVAAWFTLREEAMLGDTGSNLAGAVAGLVLIDALAPGGRLLALAVVLLITIYGEFRSISKLIDNFPPLRFIDSLGRAS